MIALFHTHVAQVTCVSCSYLFVNTFGTPWLSLNRCTSSTRAHHVRGVADNGRRYDIVEHNKKPWRGVKHESGRRTTTRVYPFVALGTFPSGPSEKLPFGANTVGGVL